MVNLVSLSLASFSFSVMSTLVFYHMGLFYASVGLFLCIWGAVFVSLGFLYFGVPVWPAYRVVHLSLFNAC